MFKRILFVFFAMISCLIFTPAAQASKEPHILLITSLGEIELELTPEKSPLTVVNFINYVNSGFYNGTVFHRVIPGFMIQGGGFTTNMQQKQTLPPIKNEANNGLLNVRGSIAMARATQPDSATSQFFINVADNAFLNYGQRDVGYAVFGKVIKGMDVVDKIAQVPTKNFGPFQDVPAQSITIISAKVVP